MRVSHIPFFHVGPEAERSVPQSLISARGLSYQLPDGRFLFQDLHLQLGSYQYGLLGLNGVGKSTLMKTLAGVISPTRGDVMRVGRVALLPAEGLGESPEGVVWPTVAEVLGVQPILEALQRLERASPSEDLEPLLALVGDRWQLEHEVAEALAAVGLPGLDPARQISTLSGGEQTRVRLAACLLQAPDFLMLDEPTCHLDREGRAALFEFLEQWPGGALIISHDRALLSQVDVIWELTPRGLEVFGGSWPEFQLHRAQQQAAAQRALESAEVALELRQRQAQAAQERQARRVARGQRVREKGGMPRIALNTRRGWAEKSTSRLKTRHEVLLEESREVFHQLKGRELPSRDLHMDVGGVLLSSQRRVLSFERVTFAYPGRAPVFEDFSLELRGPERVALVGPNGCGKSTLLKLAQGLLSPSAGRVERFGLQMATLSQLGESLEPGLSVLEQLHKVSSGMDETSRRLKLGRFFFRGDRVHTRVGALSGGERLRLGLACAFAREPAPQVLLLDEPSNHLDLESLEVLEQTLKGFGGALMVCSHDLHFLEAVGMTRYIHLR